MLRVLRPGGSLILTITNRHSPYAWWKNYIFYRAVTVWHDWRARRGDPTLNPGRRRSGKTRALYSRRSAHDLLTSEGSIIEATVGYYYNLFISPLDEVMPLVALSMTQKLEERGRALPDWMAAGFIIKARKPA
jgi:hypothetical protein